MGRGAALLGPPLRGTPAANLPAMESAPIEVDVLGPLSVRVEGQPVALGTRARRLLLAMLVRRDGAATADVLIDSVWPDGPPAEARNALQAQVSRLRRALGAAGGCVVTDADGYRLALPGGAVDADRLAAAVADAQANGPDAAPAAVAARLAEALTTWRGDPLTEAADDPEGVVEARRLEELHREAIERYAEATLAAGGGSELIPILRPHADAHPDRERLHRALAHALYRAGRQEEALTLLTTLQHRLRDELGLDPDPATTELHRRILAHDPALRAVPTSTAAGGRAPPRPRTSFVGREHELVEVAAQLRRSRLVTLTGPGGTGKTRLAVEVAIERRQAGGEVAFVELATVGDAADVLAAVAAGVGTPAPVPVGPGAGGPASERSLAERLTDHLRNRELLVLLDNCEHVIDAAAAAAGLLLDAAEGVRVLATSREPLRVPGEVLTAVPPLDVPAATDPLDPAAARLVGAVRLFLDRAHAADPRLTLDHRTVGHVVEICRRLDGLPLAIELAAARVASLPVDVLATRLSDRFRLLTTGDRTVERQRTLEAVVAWSYDLLETRQRRLLDRLGVFEGHPTLDLVEQVCTGPEVPTAEVLPILSELADRSLLELVATPGGDTRVRMLETIRDFARARLDADDAASPVRRRHAVAMADRAGVATIGLQGREQLRWLERLDHEHDDLRQALRHLLDHVPERALGMANDLAWYWWLTEHVDEGRRWVRRALEVAPPDTPALALAWTWAAFLGYFARDPEDRIAAALQEVDATLQGHGDRLGDVDRATVLGLSAYVRFVRGHDLEAARSAMSAAADAARAAGNLWVESAAEFALAVAASGSGRPEEAAAHAGRALALSERTGDRWARFQSLQLTSLLHTREGDYAATRRDLAAAAVLAQELGAREQASAMRCQHALATMLAGDLEQAHAELDAVRSDAPPDGPVTALVAHGLGLVAHRAGDEQAAVRHHRAAADTFLAADASEAAAEALAGVAFARAALDDPDGAAAAVSAAAALLRGATPTTTSLPLILEAAAAGAVAAGDADLALRRLGRAAALREPLGAGLVAGERFDVDRVEARARAQLDGDRADAALAAGRTEDGLLPPLV